MALTVTPYTTCDAPDVRAAWTRLSAVDPRATVFTSEPWGRAWFETCGADHTLQLLAIRTQADQIVGLLPACIGGADRVRWLRFLGRECAAGDHLDLLAEPDRRRECIAALLDHVAQRDDIDGLLLGELHTDSPLLAAARHWARNTGCAVLEREQRDVPYIELPDSFDAYLAQLSGNMRYHVRRRRRACTQQPEAALHCYTAWPDVAPALDALFELHRQRWQDAGESGVLAEPQKQAFLRQFCAAACAQGWTRAHVLTLHDDPVGVMLCFHWRDTASFYQMGWAPNADIDSPGVVLMAESIATAIREGLRVYDFLRGDEAYKRRWTSQHVQQTTLVVARRGPARRALRLERVKNTVRDTVCSTFGPAAWERTKRLLAGGRR